MLLNLCIRKRQMPIHNNLVIFLHPDQNTASSNIHTKFKIFTHKI
jgi:hypothetical protein